MRLDDGVKLRANVLVEWGDERTGEIHQQTVHNLVVSAGRNLLRDLLRGGVITPINYIAFGSSSTAPAAGDTALGSELVRYAFSMSPSLTTGQATYIYYMPSGSGPNGSTIQEVGLFTALTSGTMYARATFAGIAKNTSVYVKITWVLTFVDDGV